MKNIIEYIVEGKEIPIDILNEIKDKLENELKDKTTFSISCDSFTLNKRFNNKVAGYALEAIINQILGDGEKFDSNYKGYDIEIKSIKDNKYSSYNKIFTSNEIAALNSLIVIFIDYIHTDNNYTIKKISICPGSEIKNASPKQAINDAKIYIEFTKS